MHRSSRVEGAAGKLCFVLQKRSRFLRPKPSLAKEGNAAAYPPPVFPPVASLPVVADRWRRRRGMMARTHDAGSCACWRIIQPHPGHHAFGTHALRQTRRACYRWGCFRTSGGRDRPAAPPKCGCRHAPFQPMQCAVQGSLQATPETPMKE